MAMTVTGWRGRHRPSGPQSDDDQRLIDRLVAGDADAEEAFSSRYRGLAIGLARGRFGLDPLAASEVWQDVVLKLWADEHKALRAWRGEGRFSSYLTVIVVRICLRRGVASSRAEEPLAAATNIADASPDPRQQVSREERRRALASALAELSPRDRLLLALRYQDGAKPVEIAELLRLSQGAVPDSICRDAASPSSPGGSRRTLLDSAAFVAAG